jgi:hypothetical protein
MPWSSLAASPPDACGRPARVAAAVTQSSDRAVALGSTPPHTPIKVNGTLEGEYDRG